MAGQSCDEKIQDLALEVMSFYWIAIVFLALAVFACLIRYANIQPDPILIGLLAAASVILFVIEFFRQKSAIGNWKLGRDGEREVAHILEALIADGYCILHDIDTGRGNIDHVLIGPTGIYTVETKSRRKPARGDAKIWFDDRTVRLNNSKSFSEWISQAKAESCWIKSFLEKVLGRELFVRPIIACPGWFVEEPEVLDSLLVWVVNPKQISFYLKNKKEILSQEEIKAITYYLSRAALPAV